MKMLMLVASALSGALIVTPSVLAEDTKRVEAPLRLSTLERQAVEQGVASMFELQTARRTTVITHVMAGKTQGGTEYVCGYFDFMDGDGKYIGEKPFMGVFIPSSAAFIRKTFVPLSIPREKEMAQALKLCQEIGLPM